MVNEGDADSTDADARMERGKEVSNHLYTFSHYCFNCNKANIAEFIILAIHTAYRVESIVLRNNLKPYFCCEKVSHPLVKAVKGERTPSGLQFKPIVGVGATGA